MSRFYVGQRVRVRWANTPGLAGREGCVNKILGPMPDNETGEMRLGYGLDTSPIEFDPNSGWITFSDEQLEPITPPHVAGSWEVIEQLLPNIREGVAA